MGDDAEQCVHGSIEANRTAVDIAVLAEIEQRVLWLATRMVDVANRERDTADGVKVGGHQASSASLVSVMTSLWFAHLDAADRVSVKPHASPVLHAIHYLLGHLDRSFLETLRAFGGLQAYPSRTKDPDRVDFSTGSVGLGAAAPLFAAATRRYVDARFGPRPRSRFIALIGDAELDEGNIWEAVAEPVTAGLGNVMWVVDFNRQSLDRVVPGVRIDQWSQQFAAMGWHVVEVKYGQRLRALLEQPGGEGLRAWIDDMTNEHYQSLFGLSGDDLRKRFLDGAPRDVAAFCDAIADDELSLLVTDLGGHDLSSLLDAYAACDAVTDRPSVVFAYTIKGWGLPTAGNPRNHSALMSPTEIDEMRSRMGLSQEAEWDRLDPHSPAGHWAFLRGNQLSRKRDERALGVAVPPSSGVRAGKPVSTQEIFGRVLVNLSRIEEVAPYLVTVAPDVATSTNLAGFINRMGVFAAEDRRSWNNDSVLRWEEGPSGQHIELGISEMNLFLLLGQLGLAWDLSDQQVLPIGTVYDPFVLRGLDSFIYSVYSASRFIVAGTPSGVTLAPEGGAHQSTITSSVGIELPGVTYIEPAYAVALDWLLCDALGRMASDLRPREGGAFYFRLSTRPLDQEPFEAVRRRTGDVLLRRQVLQGAYRLLDASDMAEEGAPAVHLAACGAVLPEVLEAAEKLAHEGIAAHVVDVTSLDRLYSTWQTSVRRSVRGAKSPSLAGPLRAVFAEQAPIVTVHDAASHAMAWLGSALGVPGISLGVDTFGQSGSIRDLYEAHDLAPEAIINAALAALEL